MNLSTNWVQVLKKAGVEAIHWSSVGQPNALDKEIFNYAASHGHIVFTHDLDFGSILATIKADHPSVIQVRTQNINPEHLGQLVISAIRQFEKHLEKGALVTVDEKKSRVRILPL